MHEFHKQLGVPLESFSPLNPQQNPFTKEELKSLPPLLQDPLLQELGKKYSRTPGQIVLNWHIRMGHHIFPRMTSGAHLAENMEIFDFELSEDDVKKVNSMDRQARFYDKVPVERYNWIPITM